MNEKQHPQTTIDQTPLPTQAGPDKPHTSLGSQIANIELFAHRFGEMVSYTFKGIPTQPGICDGKGNGTSCGAHCICLGGQPTILPGGLPAFGISLKE